MRTLAITVILVICAGPGLCQQLAGTEPPASTPETEQVSAAQQETTASGTQLLPQRFSLHLVEHYSPIVVGENPFSAISLQHEQEFRQALWDAPMGRLHYELASHRATLGRGGLVGGEHMLGLGMGTTALGDGSHGGLRMLLQGERWSDLTPGERLSASFETAFAASLIWAIAEAIN